MVTSVYLMFEDTNACPFAIDADAWARRCLNGESDDLNVRRHGYLPRGSRDSHLIRGASQRVYWLFQRLCILVLAALSL
jgi:hypothetical protein